jgi:hypothetical protein
MSAPIVYVSTWRIKEGRSADYRRFLAGLVKVVDENEPRLPAFLTYANADLTEITHIHVFPDSATLDRHMAILGERMAVLPDDLTSVMQYLEPVRVDIYGTPGGQADELDQGLRDAGVPFAGKQRYLDGFTRPPAIG